jgi:hypothetical protein
MPLPRHKHTKGGAYRRERADSQAKNLQKDYPEFSKVPGNTKLGTLKKVSGATSIADVRKYLRQKNK